MQKSLDQMNVRVHRAVSDIDGGEPGGPSCGPSWGESGTPGSWRSCGIGAVTRSLRTLPPLVLAHPASAHTPNASCFPDRSPLRWVEPRATLRLPHRCPGLLLVFSRFFDILLSAFRTRQPVDRHSDCGLAFSRYVGSNHGQPFGFLIVVRAYYWFSHDSSTSCYPPSEHDSQSTDTRIVV